MPARNPPWSREESLLALDLYLTLGGGRVPEGDPRVEALSDLLRRAAVHSHSADPGTFRNRAGVIMKLKNFASLDEDYAGAGLRNLSKTDASVWEEYRGRESRARLHAWAETVRAELLQADVGTVGPDEGAEYREGRITSAVHRRRERNLTAVRRKKEAVKASSGELRCEVCGFAFDGQFERADAGLIECHHLKADVHEMGPDGATTRLEDLALVCANCHRVLHALAATPADLRAAVRHPFPWDCGSA